MYILIVLTEVFKAGPNWPHAFGAASRTSNAATRLMIKEADTGAFKGRLDAHQGRYIAHDVAFLAFG
jgi:hypothetical protein